jgi:hypothetical protein
MHICGSFVVSGAQVGVTELILVQRKVFGFLQKRRRGGYGRIRACNAELQFDAECQLQLTLIHFAGHGCPAALRRGQNVAVDFCLFVRQP